MDRLAPALVLAIPATVLATAFRLLSIEYALGIIWAAAILLIAMGLLLQLGLLQQTPDAETQYLQRSGRR
jgi:cytochrome c biogenesis protein CcdA